MKNKIMSILLLLSTAFLLSCSDSIEKVQQKTKEDIGEYLSQEYKEYNFQVTNVKLEKKDNNYDGEIEVKYKDESYSLPIKVSVKNNEYDYNKFIIIPVSLKKIAEESAKKLLEETINEDGWAKKNDLKVKSVTFYPENNNTYEGLVTFLYKSKEYNDKITFRYDKDGGYMYSLEDNAFSFLY